MNSKERIKRAITFNKPDRIPIFHNVMSAPILFIKYGDKLKHVLNSYPSDFLIDDIPVEFLLSAPIFQEGVYKDEWGCVCKNVKKGLGSHLIESPIKDWKDLSSYEFPDPDKESIYNMSKGFLQTPQQKYVELPFTGGIWERLGSLRGFENIMIDLIDRPKELYILTEGVLDYVIKVLEKWCTLNIDSVFFTDDWGTNTSLMINPNLWREIFKPCYKRICEVLHKHNKFFTLHSDGYIIDIIPDLIECGVDALNIQIVVNRFDKLKEFAGKICFSACVDARDILIEHTKDEIESHIKKMIKLFASFNGGLIGGMINPTDDIPLENLEIMFQTFYKYGNYPLEL